MDPEIGFVIRQRKTEMHFVLIKLGQVNPTLFLMLGKALENQQAIEQYVGQLFQLY